MAESKNEFPSFFPESEKNETIINTCKANKGTVFPVFLVSENQIEYLKNKVEIVSKQPDWVVKNKFTIDVRIKK